jgi:hypothetical protein
MNSEMRSKISYFEQQVSESSRRIADYESKIAMLAQ